MKSKLRVVTVVGTRPEIIRLSRLIPLLDTVADHLFVHTGQNTDPKLSDIFFSDLDLRQPDQYLDSDVTSFSTLMASVITSTERIVNEFNPHAAVILGDTNSAISTIVFERMGVPVYHLEAGNRSFDSNVPEELNRRLVDHVATFNLPYNDYSLRNLLAEGKHPRFLAKTGSPIREIYEHLKLRIEASTVCDDLSVAPGNFMVASIHRQENVDFPDRLALCIDSLGALSREHNLPVLVSTHPRTRLRLEKSQTVLPDGVRFHEPFGYLDYNKLQMEAKCVISDSGTISEESAILGFPAVTLRDSMERPEGLIGRFAISGLASNNVLQAVDWVLKSRQYATPEGYEESHFSHNVVNFLVSTVHLAKSWKGLHFRDR